MRTSGLLGVVTALAGESLLGGETEQGGYSFSERIMDTGFTTTATPTAEGKAAGSRIEITETTQVVEK